MALVDILLPEYDREIGSTRATLDLVPANDLDWRPAPGTRSVGDLVAHLSEIPMWTEPIMARDGVDLEDENLRSGLSEATAVDRFVTSASRGRAALVGRIDGELTGEWVLERAGKVLFALPRVTAFRVLVLNHLIHHRGQLTVYLRMRGAPVPALYGPTGS